MPKDGPARMTLVQTVMHKPFAAIATSERQDSLELLFASISLLSQHCSNGCTTLRNVLRSSTRHGVEAIAPRHDHAKYGATMSYISQVEGMHGGQYTEFCSCQFSHSTSKRKTVPNKTTTCIGFNTSFGQVFCTIQVFCPKLVYNLVDKDLHFGGGGGGNGTRDGPPFKCFK